jgi:ribosomal-protein-alanine N-acetyltransferase
MIAQELRIRPMQGDDLFTVGRLEKELQSPWSAGQIEEELRRQNGWQYVGTLDDDPAPACYACGQRIAPEAELFRLVVEKRQRRLGIGSTLLAKILSDLQQTGIATCWLEVRESNIAAIRLYEKQGFRKKGRRPAYYADPKENALIMQWVSPPGDRP